MIGYRFLPPAEEEMIEASLFYEARSEGLGFEFLDAVERLIDLVCEISKARLSWWFPARSAATIPVLAGLF